MRNHRPILLAAALAALTLLGCVLLARPALAQPTPTPAAPAAESATPTARAAIQVTTTPSNTPGTPTATGQLRLAISKTLEGSDVVKVGQPLRFTIQVTNTGTVAVTTLPLIDEFDPAILQPLLPGFSLQPDTQAPGKLSWVDVTGAADLAPGQSITIVTSFRAIKITDSVINRARIEGAQGAGGQGGAPIDTRDQGKAEGGRVIVQKALVPGLIKLDAPVISFTVTLRNEGAADIVSAPLEDTYRADVLRFRGSVPPPDSHNPATGALRWNDLLASLGVPRLRPNEVITLTTSYTVTGDIADAVVNSADATNVRDEFGNAVASPRRAEVRIRIVGVGAQSPTPTPAPTRRPRSTDTPETATPAETVTPSGETPTSPAETVTPTSTATACCVATPESAAPRQLPSTGGPLIGGALLALALLLTLCGALLRRAVRP